MRLIKEMIMHMKIGKVILSFFRLRHYLNEIGWFRSIAENEVVDKNNNSLPWYTYSSIYFISKKIKNEMIVFEYGSGNSTLWWSRSVSKVISCEHDLQYFNSLKKRIASNVEYIYCKLEYAGDYSKIIRSFSNCFDIIIIDGRDRINCVKNSLEALKYDGIIIWDNSDRSRYEKGYSFLNEHGFRRLDFEGIGPLNTYKWCTSIFYRDPNCFGI